jgi:hypothetical protein
VIPGEIRNDAPVASNRRALNKRVNESLDRPLTKVEEKRWGVDEECNPVLVNFHCRSEQEAQGVTNRPDNGDAVEEAEWVEVE